MIAAGNIENKANALCGSVSNACGRAVMAKATEICKGDAVCEGALGTALDSLKAKIDKTNSQPASQHKALEQSLTDPAYRSRRSQSFYAAADSLKSQRQIREAASRVTFLNSIPIEGLILGLSNQFNFGQRVGVGGPPLVINTGGATFTEPHDDFGGPWIRFHLAAAMLDNVDLGLAYEHARGNPGLAEDAPDLDIPNLQQFMLFARYRHSLGSHLELTGSVGLGTNFTLDEVKKSGSILSGEVDLFDMWLFPIAAGARLTLTESDDVEFALTARLIAMLSYGQEDTTIDSEVEGGRRNPYVILRTETGFAPPFGLGLGAEVTFK